MYRENVLSSSIKSVGYDSENEILEIEFRRGAIYQYSEVSLETVNELMLADSTGSYFSKNIARNYKYKQIN